MNGIIVVCFAAAYYIFTFFLLRNIKITTCNLCICSLVVAMTIVLESIIIPLPTGASWSLCSPVPLMLLAVTVDYRLAIVSGWVCGILSMLLVPGWQLVHWGQFFVEHMICFSCLGYAGVFGTDKKYKMLGGMIVASCIKTMGHLLSGVLFFSQNAWDGWGAWGYSLTYNLSQNIPLCILSVIIVMMLPLKSIRLVTDGR